MIHTTLGAIMNAAPALQRLASLPLPMRPVCHLAKLLGCVRDEAELFRTQQVALVARFGEDRLATEAETAAGLGPPFVKPDKLVEFRSHLTELLDVPVTLSCLPFDLAAIDAENTVRATRKEPPLMVTAADLVALGLYTEGAFVTEDQL